MNRCPFKTVFKRLCGTDESVPFQNSIIALFKNMGLFQAQKSDPSGWEGPLLRTVDYVIYLR